MRFAAISVLSATFGILLFAVAVMANWSALTARLGLPAVTLAVNGLILLAISNLIGAYNFTSASLDVDNWALFLVDIGIPLSLIILGTAGLLAARNLKGRVYGDHRPPR